MAIVVAALLNAEPAQAQAGPPNLVSACSGVSLPDSVVTNILSPVVNGLATPLQTVLNQPLLGLLGVTVDPAGILADAAAGAPATLQVLNTNGTAVGPADQCDLQADSYTLANPAGIAIGGNRITGLGAGPEALAGEANSIAFGNGATTDAAAGGAIALGTGANVGPGGAGSVALGNGAQATAPSSVALGAGSIAARGAQNGSAGEISVGAPGAERQITNVAAGVAPTDAVNVGQFNALADTAVRYDGAARDRVTLGGIATPTPPVAIGNLAPGLLAAGSTEAVNGGQIFALGTNVAGAIGGGTTFDPATNNVQTALTFVGAQYGSVQDALNAVGGSIGLATNPYFAVLSARAGAAVTGADSVAIGPEANAAAPNSVALGTASAADRGGAAGYAALGLADPQTSAGEVSVGGAGAERQITNVAAGSAATDAVNVGQLAGVAAQIAVVAGNAVRYDGADKTSVTLAGAGGTTITNVRAGAVNGASTDAVNGSQLSATNTNVANLTNNVANGAVGPVRYSNAATPTVPNGGTPSNDLTLVGAAAGAVALHNVADGSILPGSTDAVNGGQLFSTNRQVAGDTAALGGGASFDAATNIYTAPSYTVRGTASNTVGGAIAALDTAVGQALVANASAIQYDGAARTSATLNPGGAPTVLHNVGPGVLASDAVNLGQLQSASTATLAQANGYTDGRINALDFTLRRRIDATGAKSAALSGVPQSIEPGKGFVGAAIGGQGSQVAFAIGMSKVFDGEHLPVVKAGVSMDVRGYNATYNVGAGLHF